MIWDISQAITIDVAGAKLNARCFGPPPGKAPTIVMLHEGLGSVALWRGFPGKLAAATGFGVFAYDRRGYGASSPYPAPWQNDYMTREAVDVLPGVLDAIGFETGILLGHSDGASIATLYLGNIEDHLVRGLVLMAPHFFTEPEGLASIEQARIAYETGELRDRLAKYHTHVDDAFHGWNGAWLRPDNRDWNIEEAIDYVRVPVLAIQGLQDQYGTLKQLEALETRLYSPYESFTPDQCGHSPFADQPDAVLEAIAGFIDRLQRIENSAVEIRQDVARATD